jgi:hypothetical protein
VPFLLLLSIAATARDIYAAPVLLGFGLLIALWATEPGAGEARPSPTGLDRIAVLGTYGLVASIAAAFAALLIALAAATSGYAAVPLAISAVVVVAVTVIALWIALSVRRTGDTLQGLAWAYAAYVAAFTVGGLAVFPTIDRLQDLPVLAQRIHDDSHGKPLALLNPDETTIAMLDHRFRTSFEMLDKNPDSPEHQVAGWFQAHGRDALVLVKLPGRGAGNLTRLVARFQPTGDPGDGIATTLANKGIARVVRHYELPEGRRYALLGAPADRP